MKRVLVTGASNIGKAGVATIVYKWGQSFDENKVVYDYLMQRGLPDSQYVEAIKRKGGVIYTLNRSYSNFFHKNIEILKWYKNILKSNKYEILHINSDSAYLAAIYIWIARQCGVKTIIVHSHCTEIDDVNLFRRKLKTYLHKICKPYVNKYASQYLACSRVAGIWMFGEKNVSSKKFKIIRNGIDIENYLYNEHCREKYRKELNLEGKIVLGNIGRLSYQKNQIFLLEILKEIVVSNPECTLLLVGEGPLEGQLKEKVKLYQLENNVIFLGIRKDVPQLLQAMDVFVMPSRFEGLPVTLVEAQAAGLPCVIADTISEEIVFTEYIQRVSLDESIVKWKELILREVKRKRRNTREEFIKAKFDIDSAARELENILLGY
jgi:glycosyltransferase involved in cell wall biosynthesis